MRKYWIALTLAGLLGCRAQTPKDIVGTPGPRHPPSADARFLDMMTYHHQGAVNMAEQARTRSRSVRLKEFAGEILTRQIEEIKQMSVWRQQWFPGLPPMPDDQLHSARMGPMSVPEGQGSYETRWLTTMIAHHRGAIDMSKGFRGNLQRSELRQLADRIAAQQQAEIEKMQKWQVSINGSPATPKESPHANH